ncbi:MAG TPA: hypothetical protein VLY21_04665 [Nitrososphaerales archaeon]|nr:hypothetical protein [Nitrososphaerales archaeon]
MTPNIFPYLLYPLVHIVTLEITGLSAYYIYRQKITAYQYTKGLLLAVHILFMGVVVFEFLRTAFLSVNFITTYTIGGTTLILADVVILTLLAVTVYIVPSGIGNKSVVNLLGQKKGLLALFGAYTAFIVYAGVYLVAEQPFYGYPDAASITGAGVPITVFTNFYLVVLLVVLAVFILFPSSLLILAARKVKDPSVSRVLNILPAVWSGIGVDLLFFNGYLLSKNFDATPFGYLIASVAFGISALVFRRASLLTAFFEPVRPTGKTTAEFPFTERLGVPSTFLPGRSLLLETDPSVPYEQAVTDYARQSISTTHTVYVFTAKGSPIFNALQKMPGVRFYILSAKVSYPKPEENEPSQILIPSNDQAVILDLIDKTVAAATAPAQVSIVFDSVSDMVLSAGFEATYKFMKQVNETTGNGRTSALFLMTLGAHDEKVVSFVRSLFPTQLVDDASGLRVTRSQ